MTAKKMRVKEKFTVLTHTGKNHDWNWEEINALRMNIENPIIHQSPTDLPEILIIEGKRSEELIAKLIGHNDFKHEVIAGRNNKALPFPAPVIKD